MIFSRIFHFIHTSNISDQNKTVDGVMIIIIISYVINKKTMRDLFLRNSVYNRYVFNYVYIIHFELRNIIHSKVYLKHRFNSI